MRAHLTRGRRRRTWDWWSNSQFIDQSPAFSFDGTALYFHSPFRPGNVGGTQVDLWMTTRTKLTKEE